MINCHVHVGPMQCWSVWPADGPAARINNVGTQDYKERSRYCVIYYTLHFNIPTNLHYKLIHSTIILLSGDVELNPGPVSVYITPV